MIRLLILDRLSGLAKLNFEFFPFQLSLHFITPILMIKKMKGYLVNIEEKTLENEFFREVLYTDQHCQLVVMSLKQKETIGMETHAIVDQFIRIEEGTGKAILDGKEVKLVKGTAVIIPAGTKHNIINTSSTKKLKLYTLYSPAHHKDKTIHKTKKEALADTQDHI